MRTIISTLSLLSFFLSSHAQFVNGQEVAIDENTGIWYVTTLSGQIWMDDGNGAFIWTGFIAGAGSGAIVIVNNKLYVPYFGTITVYDLQPTFQVDTVWTIPITTSSGLHHTCWDGNNTLYCSDDVEIFEVDMTTGVSSAIFSGLPITAFLRAMEYDPFMDRILILDRGNSVASWIIGYDIQSTTYDTLTSVGIPDPRDIVLGCDDQWLIISGLNGNSVLFHVSTDLSAVDTLATLPTVPNGLGYDPVNNVAAWVSFDDVFYEPSPCAPFTSISETGSVQPPNVFMHSSGELEISWGQQNIPENNTLITLHAIDGREMMRRSVRSEQLLVGLRIELPDLTSGIYTVTLINGSMHGTAKIFIQ